MNTTAFWFFIFVSFLRISSASAQEAFTFAESVEVLLKNNAELRSAEENVQIAKSQLSSAYGNFLPNISANISYGREQVDGNDGEGYSAGINLNENIFNGFADMANLEDAKARVAVAEANLKNVKAKLSHDLKVSFAGLSYAHEAIKLADSIQRRRADNLSIVELRFQSGRENKGSVLLSNVYLKQAALDYKRAHFNLQNAKANFVRVLGLNPGFDADIKGSAPINEDPGLQNFVELAQRVPDRVISSHQLKSAEAGLKASRSSFYPNLSVSGGVSSAGTTYFPEDSESWRVGATLTWNLFNGGKDYFASKAAFANKMAAENNLRNLDLELVTRLRLAHSAFVLAIEDFEISEELVEAQSVRAEIGRGKYNNGLSTFDEWDRIENDLIDNQKSLTEKRREKAVTDAAWERAQGIGVLP